MALVRCERHGRPRGRRREYVRYVRPVGFPDNTSTICVTAGCDEAGFVWLEVAEACEYEEGTRIFELPTASAKIMVE